MGEPGRLFPATGRALPGAFRALRHSRALGAWKLHPGASYWVSPNGGIVEGTERQAAIDDGGPVGLGDASAASTEATAASDDAARVRANTPQQIRKGQRQRSTTMTEQVYDADALAAVG